MSQSIFPPTGQCSTCGGWNCTYPRYTNTGKAVYCEMILDLYNRNSMLEGEASRLRSQIFALETKTMSRNEMISFLELMNANLNVFYTYEQYRSELTKMMTSGHLSIDNRYAIFQEIINEKYGIFPDVYNIIFTSNYSLDLINCISLRMTDEEEMKFAHAIEKYSNRILYLLYDLFKINRSKLSALLEDVIHAIIIDRHVNPNSGYNNFTSGTWSVHRVMESYKEANLGKAVLTIKKIAAASALDAELNSFVKKFPEAEKYIAYYE